MNDQDWRRLQMITIYKFGKVEQHKNRWKVTRAEKGWLWTEKIDTNCKWMKDTREPVDKSEEEI